MRPNSPTALEAWKGWGFMVGGEIRRVLIKEQNYEHTLTWDFRRSFQTSQAFGRNILKWYE